jgi:hypothetical protein
VPGNDARGDSGRGDAAGVKGWGEGPAPGEDARGVEGASSAWARDPTPCMGGSTWAAGGGEGAESRCAWAHGPMPCTGRSTWEAGGVSKGGSIASKISKRAPRPVPAPWLGNNTGEYATSSNWSEAMEDECKGGDSSVETGSLAKGNTRSSNTTSRDM